MISAVDHASAGSVKVTLSLGDWPWSHDTSYSSRRLLENRAFWCDFLDSWLYAVEPLMIQRIRVILEQDNVPIECCRPATISTDISPSFGPQRLRDGRKDAGAG